jgi:hypothetical protein
MIGAGEYQRVPFEPKSSLRRDARSDLPLKSYAWTSSQGSEGAG